MIGGDFPLVVGGGTSDTPALCGLVLLRVVHVEDCGDIFVGFNREDNGDG